MRIIRADVVGHFDKASKANVAPTSLASDSIKQTNSKSSLNRHAIYSMDIQPNSFRFATGGGGNN